uniref:Putative secreted protein n=1 Tax=Ixodes ricinus TaxID=34613 RepID=A0A147BE58_IXORI
MQKKKRRNLFFSCTAQFGFWAVGSAQGGKKEKWRSPRLSKAKQKSLQKAAKKKNSWNQEKNHKKEPFFFLFAQRSLILELRVACKEIRKKNGEALA